MYEELIERLREYPDREESAGGYVEIDWQDLLDAADAIESLDDQLAALQSENVEKDREIKRLRKELTKAHTMDTLTDYNQDFLRTEIKRVEAERDAAIGDISHVCATCGQFEDGACPVLAYKDYPKGCEHWQWRGAQGEE